MKKIFFALAAVVAFASCANEETVMEAPKQAIEFGDVFVDNATRATDYTYGSTNKLKKFNVYGTVSGTMNGGGTINIFDGDLVTGTAGTNTVWSCDETQFWVPGAAYNFAAVVDATVATSDSYGMPVTLTTVADDTMNLKDMLYATDSVGSAAADQAPIDFSFSHLLSKVQFTVTSTATGDYKHTVKNIKVQNFTSGTYTIANGTWAGTDNTKYVDFGSIEGVTSSNTATNATQMLLVPNANTFKVTFTVDIYKGDALIGTQDYEKDVTIKDGDTLVGLQKGNAYNFTIVCSVGNPIQFTVTNDPTGWGDGGSVNIQ